MVVGGDLHPDEEAHLLDLGSNQGDHWGINLYLEEPGHYSIEFDSMIKVRPWQENRSRDVEDAAAKQRITEIVGALVRR